MYIIQVEALEGGNCHPIQSQSHRQVCWLEGYVALPENLVEKAVACRGYCELQMQDGVLVDITVQEMPIPSAEEPTPEEDMEALIIDHEYRLTLLELEVI